MWHILSFILCPFFLLSLSLVLMSHPLQSRRAFMLSQNTLATVAKTGVKLKQGRASGFIWFWFVLCEEFRSTFYPRCSQKTDNFTSWLRYSGIGRRRPCLALLLRNHVFCMYLFFQISHIPNCQDVTYGLKPCFVFRECSSLLRLLCMVTSFKLLIYIFIFYICCWH